MIDKKIITIIAVALVLVVGFVIIRNGVDNGFVGTWAGQFYGEQVILKLHPNGVALLMEEGMRDPHRLSWIVSENTLFLSEYDGGRSKAFRIERNRLVYLDDETFYFIRK